MPTISWGLVSAVLLAANPWPPLTRSELESGISTCRAELSAAHDRLTTQHAACTEDADCVAFQQFWLGCSGWRSIRTPFPTGLGAKIYAACIGIPSLGQDCSGNVGACISGRCMGKARSGVGCPEATEALLQRAAETGSCKSDDDCTTDMINRRNVAVSTRFTLDAARAIHAREDACVEEPNDPRAFEDYRYGKATCVEHSCRLVPADPPVYTKPRMRDPSCLSSRLQSVLAGSSVRGKATLKFVVGRDGRTGAFQFIGTVPPGVREPFIWTVLGCEWEPGTSDGKPVSVWVVLPINLK